MPQSPDGTRVYACSGDAVRSFCTVTGAPMGPPLLGHTADVTGVAFHPSHPAVRMMGGWGWGNGLSSSSSSSRRRVTRCMRKKHAPHNTHARAHTPHTHARTRTRTRTPSHARTSTHLTQHVLLVSCFFYVTHRRRRRRRRLGSSPLGSSPLLPPPRSTSFLLVLPPASVAPYVTGQVLLTASLDGTLRAGLSNHTHVFPSQLDEV